MTDPIIFQLNHHLASMDLQEAVAIFEDDNGRLPCIDCPSEEYGLCRQCGFWKAKPFRNLKRRGEGI